jgi:hypothetical protein
MHPGREGLRPIVRMTMGMDCEQGFLKEVLRRGRTVPDSCETVPVVNAQMVGESLQKLAIRSRIAIETGAHESLKLAFLRMSEFVHI